MIQNPTETPLSGNSSSGNIILSDSGFLSTPVSTNTGIRDLTGSLISSIQTGSTGSGEVNIPSSQTGKIIWKNENHFCFQDICIDQKKAYFIDNDTLVQISGSVPGKETIEYLSKNPGKNEDESYKTKIESGKVIQIKKDKSSASVHEIEVMGGTDISLNTLSKGTTVKITKSMGCSQSYKEEFFDASGKQISDPSEYLPAYPKTITIGDMILTPDWDTARTSHMFGFKFSGTQTPQELKTVWLNTNYQQDILAQIQEESANGTFERYVIRFKEIPGILFYYKNSLGSSEAIIHTTFSENDIDTEGNIISEEKTREILKLYTGNGDERKIWRSIRIKWDEHNYTGIDAENFLSEMLPLFRIKKLDAKSYTLYPTRKYEGFSSAELCKPLVYVYDGTENQKNSLSVSFPHGWAFTKVIPHFSSPNTWDFQANRWGNIQVGNIPALFGYLYYSAKVPNYQYNSDGWQIYGRDIQIFFDEKLDTIGFNAQEKKDFIDYWVDEFDTDTLYFVSFKFDEQISEYVELNFSKKPDQQMRVLLEAYPIHKKDDHFLYPGIGKKLDPYILRKFVRSGIYDVFEWGGTVQRVEYGEIVIH